MKKEQRYPVEWDHLPSVTEILGVIANPALMNWFRFSSPEKIKAASDKALNIGKTVHEIIDKIELGKVEVKTEYPVEIKNCLDAYFLWKKENRLEVVKSEFKMCSESLGYKGTLDRLCKSGNDLILLDWKTSKAIYNEAFLQVAAYQKLYEVTEGQKISKCIILRLGKDKPEFEVKIIEEIDRLEFFEIFRHALEIWKWQNKKEKTNGKNNH